jgi:acetylornithine/succinyldiaminopimelate/putrescine aminotransferase
MQWNASHRQPDLCDRDGYGEIAAIRAGSMSTLNPPKEVQLVDLLCELHPWAEMVRYARCGGEAMAVAIRIARCNHIEELQPIVARCGNEKPL